MNFIISLSKIFITTAFTLVSLNASAESEVFLQVLDQSLENYSGLDLTYGVIPHYSDPNIAYNGEPTGENNPARIENNASVIRHNGGTIENFMSTSFTITIGESNCDLFLEANNSVSGNLEYEWYWNHDGLFTLSHPGMLLGVGNQLTVPEPEDDNCVTYFVQSIVKENGAIISNQVVTQQGGICTDNVLPCSGFSNSEITSTENISDFESEHMGSQDIYFGTPDTEWIYNIDGRTGFTRVSYVSDTTVNNLLFNKFETNVTGIVTSPLDTINFLGPELLLLNDDGLIYFKYGESEIDTLYNFNAAIGDSWTIINPEANIENRDTFKITIVDTFTSIIDDNMLYGMSFTLNNYPPLDTVYNQIGPKQTFIVPYGGLANIGHSNIGGFLRCFSNDALGQVDIPLPDFAIEPLLFDLDCSPQLTSVSDNLSPSNAVSIYPNPANDELHVSASHLIYTYSLLDISGRTLLREANISGNALRIDISELDSGVYLLNLDNRIYRFVKE